MRTGLGYDVHRLVTGRDLIIGGVKIAFEKGLQGHSDADVLIHSICDALLGAAAMGDIGLHFPDTDERYRAINSMKLLERTYKKLREKDYSVVNIDSTIIAQAPKMAPYRETMEANIAAALQIPVSAVNVKATTTEHLGFIGKGQGIAAMTIALIDRFTC